jgi:uncharacterized membrane protein YidH (DUF202 family)
MNKSMSLALLVGGIVLLVFGYNAAQSTSSAFSRIFTGSPSNKAIWMIVAGAIAAVLGLVGLSRGGK